MLNIPDKTAAAYQVLLKDENNPQRIIRYYKNGCGIILAFSISIICILKKRKAFQIFKKTV